MAADDGSGPVNRQEEQANAAHRLAAEKVVDTCIVVIELQDELIAALRAMLRELEWGGSKSRYGGRRGEMHPHCLVCDRPNHWGHVDCRLSKLLKTD